MAGPVTAFQAILVAGQVVWVGILVGVLIWAFGLFLWFAPSQRSVVSVLIVVLACASFISSDLGGFFIGMILAITGGAMGFAWVPSKVKKAKKQKAGSAPAPAELPVFPVAHAAIGGSPSLPATLPQAGPPPPLQT
jgi:hypothetical protein